MVIEKIINDSIQVKQNILSDEKLLNKISEIAEKLTLAFKNNKKLLICGNGGSASDAQHLAAEFTGRFYIDRPPLNAEALHCDTSYVTAVSNDYAFEDIYERLVRAKGQSGDILIAISTSGNSKNIINAINAANKIGMLTIGLTGESGGAMKDMCSYLINIPSKVTPRIQESHIMVGHIICEIVETSLFHA